MTPQRSKSNRLETRSATVGCRAPLSVQLRWVVWLACVLVVLMAALVVRSRGLWAPDELRYAQIVQRMDAMRDLFVLQLWGSVYTEKPPLYFWLARAAAPLVGGVQLATLLVPVVLASCVLLWLTSVVAARWYGGRTGMLSVLVLLTLPLFLLLASIGRMDMLLALFVTAAVYAFYRGYVENSPVARVMAFAWMGAGLLAKGPFGVVFPLAIAMSALALSGTWQRLRSLQTAVGVGVLTTVIAGWIAPAVCFAGWDFLQEILGRQVIERAVTGLSHDEPLYFYFWVLPIILVPWVVFVLPSLAASWKRWRDYRDRRELWLMCWIGVPLVILSLVRDKLAVYLLPIMPPIAILVGRYWSEVFSAGEYSVRMQFRVGWLFVLAALIGLVALGAALLIAHTPSPSGAVRIGELLTVPIDGETSCLLLEPRTLCFGGSVLLVIAMVGWAGMRMGRYHGLAWTFGTLASVVPCGLLFLACVIMPSLNAALSWRAVADAMAAVGRNGEPVVMYGLRPFAAYYLNQDVTWFKKQNSLGEFVRRNGSVWCATREHELDEISRHCIVEHDPGWWYPSTSGPVLLVHLRSLAVAERTGR